MKKLTALFSTLTAICLLLGSACGGGGTNSSPSVSSSDGGESSSPDSSSEIATFCEIYPVSYSEVKTQTDMETFYNETKQPNGASHDGPLDYGFVEGVYHSLTVNEKKSLSIPRGAVITFTPLHG